MDKGYLLQRSNLFLLFLFFFMLGLTYFLRIDFNQAMLKRLHKAAPVKMEILNADEHVLQTEAFPVNKIYGYQNIFDLPPENNDAWGKSPIALAIPEMVDLKFPDKKPTPKTQPAIAIIDPLNISISGVIISDNFYQNACMITGLSGKEKLFKVGQKVEDSIITSISKSAVCLIRPNGQVEHFAIGAKASLTDDQKIFVRVIDQKNVNVDYRAMLLQISSIGELLQELGIVAHWVDGVCKGFVVTASGAAVEKFGLKEKDVIISVAEHTTDLATERVLAYKKVIALDYGQSFPVVLMRGGQEEQIVYSLEKFGDSIKKAVKDGKKEDQSAEQESAKLDVKNQEKVDRPEPEKSEAPSLYFPAESMEEYQENIEKIRARLLEKIGENRVSSLG